MIEAETSVVINRPVEKVFAFVNDSENAPQWRSSVLESRQTSEGPIGVGTTLAEVIRFLGRRIESTFEVTEYEPNSKISAKTTSGPIPFEVSRTFESVEGGTRLTVTIEGETGGFFKLAEPLVARMTKRQIETDHANLKDLLEAQAEGSV